MRKLGLIFTVLGLTLQSLYFLAPPEPSLASSPSNDILYGSSNSELTPQQILSFYDNNRDNIGHTDIQKIMHYFGIGRAELVAAVNRGVFQIQSYASNEYWSVGRQSRWAPPDEIPYNIPGGPTIYARNLHKWDTGPYSTYNVIGGTNNKGDQFWIMLNCGNIITKKPYDPTPDPPGLHVRKSLKSPVSAVVKPGDEVKFDIRWANLGPGTGYIVAVKDVIPEHTSYVRFETQPGIVTRFENGVLTILHDTPPYPSVVPPSNTWFEGTLVVKVKGDTPPLTQICNIATISDIDGQKGTSDKICVTTEEKKPIYSCRSLEWIPENEAGNKGRFRITASAVNTKITNYVLNPGYDAGDPITVDTDKDTVDIDYEYPDEAGVYEARARVRTEAGRSEVGNCIYNVEVTPPGPDPIFVCQDLNWEFTDEEKRKGFFTIDVRAENTEIIHIVLNTGVPSESGPIFIPAEDIDENGIATYEFEYPEEFTTWEAAARVLTEAGRSERGGCVLNVNRTDDSESIVTHSKRVSNLTAGVENADNTFAAAGDELEYTLITENVGDKTAIGFTLPAEDIADILEYTSEPYDYGDAIFNKDKKQLTWPVVTIQPGQKIEKKFKVRIMNPIPETPVSASDPGSYDLLLSNVYGDEDAQVKLPETPGKTVEKFARRLPNTGIGDNAFATAALVIMVTYFYYRNRLIRKELEMIKKEFTS